MKIYTDIVQGSSEWHEIRRGVPTASEFDKIITTKGEPSKQREKYLFKLAGEAVSGICEETFKSAAMERGIILEAEARTLYELITRQEAQQVGFCVDNDAGCSPDALIGDDGGLEVKCPTTPIFVSYLLDNKIPTDYILQVQGSLFVTGRKWWDFMAYHPGSIKPLIVRAYPDEKLFKALKVELEIFKSELQDIIKKIS